MQTKTFTFRLLLSLMLAASLGFAGCGDDDNGGQNDTGTDQGPHVDRGLLPDAGTPDLPVTQNDMHVVDTGPQPDQGDADQGEPDQGGPVTCDPACQAESPWLCVNDSGQCVECTTDAHCQANPNALGPVCDTTQGWCVCSDDASCAGNINGAVCDLDYFICGCEDNNDCGSTNSVCLLENTYVGLPVCQAPCSSDADCADPTPTCDATSGACVECLSDNDCGGDAPYCNATTQACVACASNDDCGGPTPFCNDTGDCVECLENSQCADNPYGGLCDGGYCSCVADSDCGLSSYAFGNTCVSLWGLFQLCGCDNDNGCTDNPHGPTCNVDWQGCSCSEDAACTADPYTKCAFESDSGVYEHCQEPCTDDADCVEKETLPICNDSECIQCLDDSTCTDEAAPHCDTADGLCVRCLSNDDCTPGYPICNTTTNECVECSDNADCAGSLNGSACDAEQGICTCAADADCAGNRWGPTCVDLGSGDMRCGCEADTDCGSNVNGPTCYTDYAKCSCADDTQCADATLTECALPYAGASYSHCQAPCTGNADCAANQEDTGLPVCSDDKCVECMVDGDCTMDWFNQCMDSACVMCETDADCDASSLGSSCDTANYNYCICASDADCAANANGGVCDGTYSFCSCESDADCPGSRTCSRALSTTGVMLCQ